MRFNLSNNFDYIKHYKIDADEFDYFEERLGATKDDERRLRQYIISLVDNHCNFILDIGCGSGWVAHYFSNKNIKVISNDLSKKNVKKSLQKTNSKYHLGLVFDSFNPAIKNDSVDVMISSEVIEHVIDPFNFIKNLSNLLKPKGKLILSTPYNEIIRYVLCIHCNKKTPIHAHLHSFTEKFFVDTGNKLGLKTDYYIFGNKLLIFLRTYTILRFLPFKVWLLVDKLFNFLYNKPVHLVVVYTKN